MGFWTKLKWLVTWGNPFNPTIESVNIPVPLIKELPIKIPVVCPECTRIFDPNNPKKRYLASQLGTDEMINANSPPR